MFQSKRPGALVLLWLAGACSGGDGGSGGSPCSVTAVSVAASPQSISSGGSSALTATVTSQGSCGGGVSWSAAPPGGTLTPSGLTASFTASTAGTYTVTATSSDDAARSGSATVTVTIAAACGVPNGTVVMHTGSIGADETWAGDNVTHSVPSDINITDTATVTIEPCAIVALGAGASITVRGSGAGGQTAKLVAAGESAERFVSFVRADASQPWGFLRGYNETSAIELRHTTLTGGGDLGGSYHNAAIQMNGPGYGSLPGPLLKVQHVTIDGPVGSGVYLDVNAAFTADSDDLTIKNAPDYPFAVTMMSLGSLPAGTYVGVGNAVEETLIIGPGPNVFADMTVKKRLPVRIAYGSMYVGPPGNEKQAVTLTIEPGVVLRFPPLSGPQPGAMLRFGGNGNDPNNPVGVLVAMGTAADPIVFTSGAATPAAGDWSGIWLDTANGSRLDHVVIEYAGGDNGISSVNCRPLQSGDEAALIVGDFSDQYVPPADFITNSVIAHSAGHGINAIWHNGDYSPNVTGSANGNTIADVAGCAQTLNSLPMPCTMNGCQP